MADKICNGCGQKENSGYEVALAFAERTTVRLWVVIILLITLLVGTNIGWLVYEAQFETVETTEEYHVEQEAEGGYNNSIVNGGDIVDGEAKN